MIPFNRATITGRELGYLRAVIEGTHLSGDGPFTQRCQTLMEKHFGAAKVLLTPSCTAALEMAALLLEIGAGDEVIMPSYTFVSTANAFVLRGARPVFIDVRSDTLNMDESLIEAAITERTRAVVPVHYAGVACDMDAISRLCGARGMAIVEDAAQGVNARYGDSFLGTLGALGAYSFHESKNFVCGEGGALVINSTELIERAEILREKGTNRSKFFRGQVDKYTWVDIGSSFLPSELQAAFLLAQLEAMDDITVRRKNAYDYYCDGLSRLATAGHMTLPVIPPGCASNYHLFHLLLGDGGRRDDFLAHLKANGVGAVFHYVPLHVSAMGRKFGCAPGSLPVTEDLSERLVRLPLFADITSVEQDTVLKAIHDYFAVPM